MTPRGTRTGAPRGRAFIGYPTNHVLAVLDDAVAGASVAAELSAAGIATRDISVLRGEEGASRLDGTGTQHGAGARAQRAVSFTLMDQAPDMAWYESAVRAGAAVVMVRTRGDASRAIVLGVLGRHAAHFVNFYGRFATEEIVRWRGPEPGVPDVLKR